MRACACMYVRACVFHIFWDRKWHALAFPVPHLLLLFLRGKSSTSDLSHCAFVDQTPDQPFVLGSLNSLPNPGTAPGLFLAQTMWMRKNMGVLQLNSTIFFIPQTSVS